MASGVVNLIFRMFKQGSGLQDAIDGTKRLQGNVNDLSRAGRILGTVFGTTGGVVGQMVGNLLKGGMWEFAARGVGLIIDKWQEYKRRAKEAADAAAKALRDSMTAAAESVTESFRKIFSSYAKERKGIAADLSSANAATSNAASGAKADVDIRAVLDSIGQPDSEKRVVAAKAAYEKGMIDAAASVKKATDENTAAQKTLEVATMERIKAEEALEAAERAEAEFRSKFGAPMADREMYQKFIAEAEQNYWKGLISFSYRNKIQAEFRQRIASIEEKNKDVFEQMGKNTKAVADARAKLAEATEAHAAADRACEATTDALMVAEKQRTATEMQLEAAVKEAEAAQVAAAKKRKEDEEKAAKRAAKARHDREARAKAEEDTRKAREDAEKKISDLDIKLAAARKRSLDWETRAQSARGKNFYVWQREENDAEKSRKETARRFASDNRDADRRAARIRSGRFSLTGGASASERRWLAQYDEWRAMQNANGNSAAEEVRRMEAERVETIKGMATTLQGIRDDLAKTITTE